MPDDKFTVEDYDRILDDIIDEYFEQHRVNYDLKDLAKIQLTGENEEIGQIGG